MTIHLWHPEYICNEMFSVRKCAVRDRLVWTSSLDAVEYRDNGGPTWLGKARKSTGSLHGNRYSMPKVQGRRQLISKDS